MADVHLSDSTRRHVLSLLGAAAGLRLFSGAGPGIAVQAAPAQAAAGAGR